MKPENDTINWHNVLHANEPTPPPFANPDEQYWQQQLADINQKLFNLNHVSLTEPVYCEQLSKYTTEKETIWQQLDKLK